MIRLTITELNFEQDIYALLKSFYPGEDIKSEIVDKGEEAPYRIIVLREEEEIVISLPELGIDASAAYPSRFDCKSYVKREVYKTLSKRTGKVLPWGTLTGIRPAHMVSEMRHSGHTNEEIAAYFKREFLISERKLSLCMTVSEKEEQILAPCKEDGYSLYIGIPFCPSRCLYCSFTSFSLEQWKDRVEDYLQALFSELTETASLMEGRKLHTIYIGGGTPTTLTSDQLHRLLSKVKELFDVKHALEFTVEAGRPDSITREKLQVLFDHGIRRISVNPQTMQQKTLDLIGRKHTIEDTVDAFFLAREIGFDNINMDLIMGLPNETMKDVEDTLIKIKELKPDSLTVHSLAIKRAARLNTMRDVYSRYPIVNSDPMIEKSRETAEELGLSPYYLYRQKNMAGNFENVGYAAEGKACLYNILIMEEYEDIVACGAGAASKRVVPGHGLMRCDNVKDIHTYINKLDEMIQRKRDLFCNE